MNKLADWPAPGVYANIPFTQYITLNAVNATLLKALAAYAAKKAYARVLAGKSTPATIEGQALHVFMLEPKRFTKEYMIALPCGAKLKSGPRQGEACGASTAQMTAEGWRCKSHATSDVYNGITAITAELHERLIKAREEIWRTVPDLMRSVESGKTETELTLLWMDPETELLCKCRLDYFTPGDATITDIKKCRSAQPNLFGGDVGLRCYHVQDAWYRRGAAACFGDEASFEFLAVELQKDEVNGVQLLGLGEEEQAAGESAAQTALKIYAEMTRTKGWTDNKPVYSQGKKLVKMRPYMIRAEDA